MERYFILLIGGLLAAIVEQQIITLVDTIFIAPSRRKKILENKTWKSVTAEEVSKYAEPDESGHYNLIYKWTVDGRNYHGRFDMQTDNQPSLTLYYVNNPDGAVKDLNAIGQFEYRRILFIILILVNAAAVFLLFR